LTKNKIVAYTKLIYQNIRYPRHSLVVSIVQLGWQSNPVKKKKKNYKKN